jgi:hypothetical protein
MTRKKFDKLFDAKFNLSWSLDQFMKFPKCKVCKKAIKSRKQWQEPCPSSKANQARKKPIYGHMLAPSILMKNWPDFELNE